MSASEIETEIAFTFPRGHTGPQYHPLLALVEPVSQQLVSTYFDTPTHALSQQGWTVRKRVVDGAKTVVQTVKGPSSGFARFESEIKLDDEGATLALDYSHLRATPVWEMLAVPTERREVNVRFLAPVFQTKIYRSMREISVNTTTIEVALDWGSICDSHSNKVIDVADLELEMKDGDITDLLTVAIRLVQEAGLILQPSSKAERGFQMVRGGDWNSVKYGDDISLYPLADTKTCFRQIILSCFAHLRSNMAAAAAGTVDGIHQCRVALRRLRSALVFFHNLLDPKTAQTFEDELGRFGQIFGHVRDLDVFIGKTLPKASENGGSKAWTGLLKTTAEKSRIQAHGCVVSLMRSSHFNSLLLGLIGWVEQPLFTPKAMASVPFKDMVPNQLAALYEKVQRRRGRVNGDIQTLHSLRKAVKKLRYGVEFVESLYDSNATKRLLKPCKDLQEVLGSINDVDATYSLVNALIGETPALSPALEHLHLPPEPTGSQPELPKLLRRLHRMKPFWAE